MSKLVWLLAVVVLTGCDLKGSRPFDQAALALVAVSAGWGHSCGLVEEGAAYCWGGNSWGELGAGADLPLLPAFTPIRVAGDLTFRSISAGQLHSCALTHDGSAYCWGRNAEGQLGTGTNDGPSYCASTSCSTEPVAAAAGLVFQSLDVGWRHSCGVTLSGAVYCWGDGSLGQLGEDGLSGPVATPVAVSSSGAPFQAVSTSRDHTCALSVAGSVYCWGSNHAGQVGRAESEECAVGAFTADCVPTPHQIAGFVFVQVETGGDHSCGLTTEGFAYCWGSNGSGQLGLPAQAVAELCEGGDGRSCASPVPVAGDRAFVSVASGGSHNCAIDEQSDAYCWGANQIGQVGDCSGAGFRTTPSLACGGLTFSSIAAGGTHTCAVSTGRVGYCWGDNDSGALGSQSFTALGPVRVAPVILPNP